MYQKIKQYLKSRTEEHYPKIIFYIHKYKIAIKYIISGGISALVLFSLLYSLTDIVGLWYIYSTIIAFVFSLVTNFILQKFWTFRDDDLKKIKKQFAIYFILGAVNFALNPSLLYVLVDRLHVWYIFGEALVVGLLAIMNFLLNKFFIFKKEEAYESIDDKL